MHACHICFDKLKKKVVIFINRFVANFYPLLKTTYSALTIYFLVGCKSRNCSISSQPADSQRERKGRVSVSLRLYAVHLSTLCKYLVLAIAIVQYLFALNFLLALRFPKIC